MLTSQILSMLSKNMTFNERWPEKYPPINPEPAIIRKYGSDDEPTASQWMSALSEAAGDGFREGMIVLDYGCGSGRYANFISRRLRNFTYYGVEPILAGPKHGMNRNPETNLEICERNYGQDPRVWFGPIGGEIEHQALDKCDWILAGSVFTHLAIDEYVKVISKFSGAIKQGAKFVHTIFYGQKYLIRQSKPYPHGLADFYSYVLYTEQLAKAAWNGFNVKQTGTFKPGSGKHTHIILVMQA